MNGSAYIKVTCEVRWLGSVLKTVPFVFDCDGVSFEPLNVWVRENFPKWSKVGQAVNQKVSRVVHFLNFLVENNRSWDEPTQYYLLLYVRVIEKGGITAETLNAHTNAIFEFFWRCEKRGFCTKVIGINDSDQDDYRYPLHVLSSRSPKRDFDNPLARRGKNRTLRSSITQNSEWEIAYERALDFGTAACARDAVFISFILQTGARRKEATSLKTSDFEKQVSPNAKEVIISVDTKYYESRDLVVPLEAYLEIQEFIRDERPALIANRRKDQGYVFCGERGNGKALTKTYVSRRMRDTYQIAPHDGRSTFATNQMVEHYRNGLSLESAMLLVRQRMGHSATDETARTLRQHYLQAKAIVEAQESGSKLDQAREEIAQLKAKMANKDLEIEDLRRQVALTSGVPTSGRNTQNSH